MAKVISLGVHQPSAFSFLNAEGIHCAEGWDKYTWKNDQTSSNTQEDELLLTDHCVVWSQNGLVRRVYRFDVEGESVTKAVFSNLGVAAKQTLPVNRTTPENAPPKQLSEEECGDHYFDPSLLNVTAPAVQTRRRADTDVAHGNRFFPHQAQTDIQRALLVILRSQAQVFFLNGTSHAIHLPFEVERIFPLPIGVLIQRKSSSLLVSRPAPKLPNPPQNSFAIHSEGFQSQPLHLQDTKLLSAHALHTATTNFEAAASASWVKSRGDNEESLDLFYLTDPLSELAVMTAAYLPESEKPSTWRAHGSRRDAEQTSVQGEILLYVSSEDELLHSRNNEVVEEPLMIALSLNRAANSVNFWAVGNQRKNVTNSIGRKSESGVASRRRSSHGPGFVTGANTPVSRSFMDPRESFGAPSGRTSTAKDILLEGSEVNGDDNLSSQLGSALEPSGLASKPSRRVSSLLARADLSASFGGLNYPELRNSHQVLHKPRRAISTGTYGNRSGIGNHAEYSQRSTQSIVVGQNVANFTEVNETSSIGDDHETNIDSSGAEDGLNVYRRRDQSVPAKLHLTMFYSIRHEHIIDVNEDDVRVFVLHPPSSSLSTRADLRTLYLGLFDRNSRSLEMYRIDVRCRKRKISLRSDGQKPGTRYEILEESPRKVSRVALQCDRQVIDVCTPRVKFSSHVILLSLGKNGVIEVTVQAPWAEIFRVDLPSIFSLHNPFQITDLIALRSRREGGLKRVLSQGPGLLARMGHVHGDAELDFINAKNVHHRLDLRLMTKSRYIGRLIEVCEAVLPPSLADQDLIVGGWRKAYMWLASRWEEGDDIDWPALLVFIFSLVAPYVKDARSSTVLPPRRRKGGLLRSSSGAHTNLENWETMIDQEKNTLGTSPPWLQQAAWKWAARPNSMAENRSSVKSSKIRIPHLSTPAVVPMPAKTSTIVRCTSLARDFHQASSRSKESDLSIFPRVEIGPDLRVAATANILLGLHSLREELKLDTLAAAQLHSLTPVLAQLGTWLKWPLWSFRETSHYIKESADMADWLFDEGYITGVRIPRQPLEPPNIFLYLTEYSKASRAPPFPSMKDLLHAVGTHNDGRASAEESDEIEKALLPRSSFIRRLIHSDLIGSDSQLSTFAPESMPPGVMALIRHNRSEKGQGNGKDRIFSKQHSERPKSHINLEDVVQNSTSDSILLERPTELPRDIHNICNSALETQGQNSLEGSAEVHRQSVIRMLFKDDQRFVEAAKLLHPLLPPTARCDAEPDWSDTDLLEAQQELVKTVALRTLSVSPGRGCLSLNSRSPLLTEKFPIHGFTLSCVMKPSNTTVTADRNSYTEEKVSWAFFHAGVEAGLSITKHAKGIDTSWILFNKPSELKNRHAGFLLALGLNGHLKTIAKWVAFKYLTPKHTMTSIGLLLGLSASYLGTMDTLVTRLLSVHVTRMLPPGAAELNLSPLTQTSGIMGIGLLYCGTQHRRMTEIMLSEIENTEDDDSQSGNEALRDESYRLAAGFALGFINLGCGDDLKGLHDMHIVERLLSMAVGNKKVSLVHILDKATPGAIMAVAMIFMKTHNEPLARKIDIPDTVHQYDSVRSDVFLLRTVTRHLIMWNDILPSLSWVRKQLPGIYQSRSTMVSIRTLKSVDMAFFNIVAGICLSIGLRHAGSGSTQARDVVCFYLDHFTRICRLQALNYDARLTQITVRNCQDTIALAAASVMAGTGDLLVFRRLRSLHGRTDVDTPYGSHMAAHLAIGILFLGGGTHALSTCKLAIASLLCAFYPLFPSSVLDNKVHLQAFRHFWVLAAEARCLIVHDIETRTGISLPIVVHLQTGDKLALTAPCLLPELNQIVKVHSKSPDYWEATFDFANRASDIAAFKRHQTLFVRRCTAYDTARSSLFSVTMQTMNDTQSAHQVRCQMFGWIFTLPSLARLDRAEATLVLPPHIGSSQYTSLKETVIDDQLVLEKTSMESGKSERLWNLRLLFEWAANAKHNIDRDGWISKEFLETLKARLAVRRAGVM